MYVWYSNCACLPSVCMVKGLRESQNECVMYGSVESEISQIGRVTRRKGTAI